MMRVGKRALQKERPLAVIARMTLQPGDGPLLDESRRITRFRYRRLIDLRRADTACSQCAAGSPPGFEFRGLALQPFGIVPGDQVPVSETEGHILKAIVGGPYRFDMHRVAPGLRHLASVVPTGIAAAHGFPQLCRRRPQTVGVSFPRRLRRFGRHSLKMALADERGAKSRGEQQVDEGNRVQMQRNPVVSHPMDPRNAPGHERGAVAHAGGRRYVEPRHPRAAAGNTIDIRRSQQRVAGIADVVPTLLIRDEEKEIGRRHRQAFSAGARSSPSRQ